MPRHERSVSANCGEIWIDGDFWFSILAAAGLAAAYLLNQAITMAGRKRRRKRRIIRSISDTALSRHFEGIHMLRSLIKSHES